MLVGYGLLIITSALVFGPGLISGLIAWNKGYRPWFWLLSFGPLGTLIVALTPALSRATTPEERERMESRADWTGGILSGFTVMPMFALPVLGALYFFSFSAPMVPPTPVLIEAGPEESAPAQAAEPLQAEQPASPEQ
jgi:hypothetical protein